MDKGKYLLANTTKSIGEISMEMGSQNSMSTSFLKKTWSYVHLTPQKP